MDIICGDGQPDSLFSRLAENLKKMMQLLKKTRDKVDAEIEAMIASVCGRR